MKILKVASSIFKTDIKHGVDLVDSRTQYRDEKFPKSLKTKLQ